MAKNYAEDFKKKYSFLEEYGFVFAVDPFNSERLCYKNQQGEIVLWFTHDSYPFTSLEIYVQINGWKTTINVKEEYKKYVGKSTLFKSLHVLFKELFIARVRYSGYFYGLKTEKISGYNTYVKAPPLTSFNEYFNPLEEKRKSIVLTTFTVFLGVLFLTQMFLTISIVYITSYYSIFIIRNIIYSSMIIFCFGITLLLWKQMNLITKILFNVFPMIVFSTLYMFEKRIDYEVCFIFFALNFLISAIYIVLYLIRKDSNALLNGILIIFYPFSVCLVKMFELNKYLFFTEEELGGFLIVGLIISLIVVLTFILKCKDRTNKKEFLGKLFMSLFLPFILSTILPILITHSINYAFDDSIGIKQEFFVVSKHERYGGRSGPRYYLVIYKDGVEEDISVARVVYEKYYKGSYIELVLHEGYLNMKYYEYVADE